jgi:uncharacterized delta-60 repeat protein
MGQNFTATSNTYTVSGVVPCLADVTVTLTGASSSTTTTDSSGNFTFSEARNGSYTITASKTGYSFSLISVTVNNSNITGQNFTVTSGPSGSLDTNFGTCGVVTTDIRNSNNWISAIGIQSDGKIVAAGQSYNGSNNDITLVRYNTDGSLDSLFGTGGVVITDVRGSGDATSALIIQSDGRIVVAGGSNSGTNNEIAVIRYNTDGSLDSSFGTGGIVTKLIGSENTITDSLDIQSDGKIVIGARYANGINYDIVLLRYTANGTLDTTFGGGDGIVTTAIGTGADRINDLVILSDGKIVAAGFYDNRGSGSNNDIALLRYTADGTLDTTFGGGDGIVTTERDGASDVANALGIQSDGKIMVAGSGSKNKYFLLVRYTAVGIPDSTFGTEGIVTTSVGTTIAGGYNSYATALRIQSNGRIVAAGSSYNNDGNLDFALVRYNTNGSLDSTFGTGGIVTTPIGDSHDAVNGLVIQSDGRILLVGYSTSDGNKEDFALARYWP